MLLEPSRTITMSMGPPHTGKTETWEARKLFLHSPVDHGSGIWLNTEKEACFGSFTLDSRWECRLRLKEGGQCCTYPRVEVAAATLLPPKRSTHLSQGRKGHKDCHCLKKDPGHWQPRQSRPSAASHVPASQGLQASGWESNPGTCWCWCF